MVVVKECLIGYLNGTHFLLSTLSPIDFHLPRYDSGSSPDPILCELCNNLLFGFLIWSWSFQANLFPITGVVLFTKHYFDNYSLFKTFQWLSLPTMKCLDSLVGNIRLFIVWILIIGICVSTIPRIPFFSWHWIVSPLIVSLSRAGSGITHLCTLTFYIVSDTG